ncbi:ferredoxin [Mycolicibacterium sp. XJ1819]
MRVMVDLHRCHGHGLCLMHAPEVFDMSEDGRSLAKLVDVGEGLANKVRRAVANCPEQALSLE